MTGSEARNEVLRTCAGCRQNLTEPSATHPVKFFHSEQPQQLNDAAENTCDAEASVQCDSSRWRSSPTPINKDDLRLATVRRRPMTVSLPSLVAMFDDHAVDDVTARDTTAAPVDRVEHVAGSRDTYFRSACVADVANCATQQSRRGDTPVNKRLVDESRDCRLTSYDEFPFPVVNESGDVSANQQQCDDVMTPRDDGRQRRRRTMATVEHRVSESSGADSSVVYSDSVASGDTGKSRSRLVLCPTRTG